MNIRLINENDNIEQYMECVSSLNKSECLDTIDNIKLSIVQRPKNILTFVMVSDDNNIIATSTVIVEKKLRYSKPCCHIEDVAVHKEHRNKGYGADIVRFCMKVAKDNNCYKIKLNCAKDLVSFYNKLGFKRHEDHMYILGEDL